MHTEPALPRPAHLPTPPCSGTSFAAPLVSAAAALVLQAAAQRGLAGVVHYGDVKEALLSSVDVYPALVGHMST